MSARHGKSSFVILVLSLFLTGSLACRIIGLTPAATPSPVVQVTGVTQIVPVTAVVTPTPTWMPPSALRIILQRLEVSFLGLDGHRLIGSGCPGVDGKGTIVDYHLSVSGVDTDRRVTRVAVTGDNSTLTWSMPCSDSWALHAADAGDGNWDVFIAPSERSRVYTVLFFYSDNTLALGMTTAP